MIKLITFNDTNAIWTDEAVAPLSQIVCRQLQNLELLPDYVMLQFNCNEADLARVSNSRNQFHACIQRYYVPELLIKTKRHVKE